MDGMAHAVTRVRLRPLAFAALLFAIFAVLVWRLADTQLRHGAEYARLADLNQLRTIAVEAPRGLLYDRRGRIVVSNRASYAAQIVPMQIEDPNAEIALLAESIGVPRQAIWDRLLHRNGVAYKSFEELSQAIPLGPVTVANDLGIAQVGRFYERADRLPGVRIELVPVRKYPYGTLGSHAFGYIGQITQRELAARRGSGYGLNDLVGKDGVEYTYDRDLRGRSGGELVKVNAAGQAVESVGDFAAEPGHNLELTLDWDLQQAAESAMARQIDVVAKRIGNRIAGAAIAIDPNNGEVLALVSQPNFDPNDFAAGISGKRYLEYLRDPLLPLYDRAIDGAYPTGSTFKIITSSAALSTGVLTPASTRYCGGAFVLGIVFNDDVAGGHGTLDVPQAIGRSCDVFFYQVGHQLGIERLDRYAALFGIGRTTGIDVPGESPGTLPSPDWKKRTQKEDWYPGDTVNMAIGQGYVEATPAQMVRVAAAIANGGTIYVPHLVAAERDGHGRVVRRFLPRVQARLGLSPEALDVVRRGMLAAIEGDGGTARNVQMAGFHYAGKTGTAENVPTPDNPAGRNHAWFICYAPFDHPRLAVAVVMEKSGGFGAMNAAPVAQAIVQAYFHIRSTGPNGSGIRD